MAEQMSTPGSNADGSANGGRTNAPKDKNCPFCNQSFTSSSLGRHLDLYIKGKNPKSADGVHDAAEIRKIRGNITRRQARNSTARNEGPTPARTPVAEGKTSHEELDASRRSASPRGDHVTLSDSNNFEARQPVVLSGGSWEATGVMDHIPAVNYDDSNAKHWNGDEAGDGTKTKDGSTRLVSRQVLAKVAFEQKQRVIDALDEAKAAKLALRELLGGLRAAKQRVEGPDIFDYDPLSVDFPALALKCLPPPPTLQQSTAPPTATSWSISPPDEQQYNALRAHFTDVFHNWRVSCAVANTDPRDELYYPLPTMFTGTEDREEAIRQAEADASILENRVFEHLHNVFGHWLTIPRPRRTELWTLELARNVGQKSDEISKLKREKQLIKQEAEHKHLQIEELSRLQLPKESKIMAPSTISLDGSEMDQLGELWVNSSEAGFSVKSTGFSIMDRHVDLDTVTKRVIGRWKGIVKHGKGANIGMAVQRSLSGDQRSMPLTVPSMSNTRIEPSLAPSSGDDGDHRHNTNAHMNSMPNHVQNRDSTLPDLDVLDSDQDADGDADMEEDDSFAGMTDISTTTAPSESGTMDFRLGDGSKQQIHDQSSKSMDRVENQACVGEYMRIGA